MMMSRTGRIAGAAAALLAALGCAASAQEVGKASAVNPAATANLRTITIGSSISHKERIKTAAEGSVQLLFIDKTSMTIGPNSDLTIDEYVYNPNAGTGKLAATLGKGALRFVGGQISHSGDAEIKTADAVIGIRGGVALISTANVYAGYGSSTVTSRGGSVTLGAGEFTAVSGGGAPPSPPGPPPEGFVARMIQSFQSAGGQSGGAPKGTASPANVARAESRATGRIGGAVAGSLTPAPVVTHVAPLLAGSTTTTSLAQTIQTSTQSGVVQNVAKDMRPTVTLTAWVGGLMRSVLPDGYYGPSVAPMLGVGSVSLDGTTNRVQANFAGAVRRDETTPYAPGSFNYQYGFQDPAEDPRGAYADYNNFGADVAIRKDGQVVSTIDGAPITDQRGAMVVLTGQNSQAFLQQAGAPHVTACDCDYTRWGIWASESRQSGFIDTVAGFWVAGRPIAPSDVPATGIASYSGHVIGAVQNGTTSYVAAGNLTNTVNFATRSGTSTVTGFDNANYTGQLVLTPSDPRYLGAYLTAGDRSMVLAGSFFVGRSSPVGEMGGSMLVNGSNYVGSGIFAARMK